MHFMALVGRGTTSGMELEIGKASPHGSSHRTALDCRVPSCTRDGPLCVLSCLFFFSLTSDIDGWIGRSACLTTQGLAPVRDLSVSKLVPGTGARAAVQAARSWREQLAKRWPRLEAGSGMGLQSRVAGDMGATSCRGMRMGWVSPSSRDGSP